MGKMAEGFKIYVRRYFLLLRRKAYSSIKVEGAITALHLLQFKWRKPMQRPIESNTPQSASRRSLPSNPTQLPPGSETASPKVKKDAQNILRQLTRIMSSLEIDEEYEHQLQMIETGIKNAGSKSVDPGF